MSGESSPATRFCGSCGTERDATSTNFCRVCGARFASPSPTASSAPPGAPTAELSSAVAPVAGQGTTAAGFWRRTGAALIDVFIVLLVALILAFAYVIPTHRAQSAYSVGYESGQAWFPLVLLVSVVYFIALWWSQAGGRTLAMRIFDLKVIRLDGSGLGIGTSVLRYVGLWISVLFLFIGVVWVAFDPKRQGWHDKIAGTLVVRA